MGKQKHKKRGVLVTLAIVAMTVGLTLSQAFNRQTEAAADLSQLAVDFDSLLEDADSKYLYLSDVEPLAARVGWGQFLKDQVDGGRPITMRYDGGVKTFKKGLWAHATSNLYYDLEAIGATERDFDVFMAYVGLNTSSGAGDGVTFRVYGSNAECVGAGQCLTTASNWTQLTNLDNRASLPGKDAEFIRVSVADYRYIRLEANQNAGNGQDHSVWAEAKLAKADYQPYLMPSAEEMDAEIAALGEVDVVNNPEHRLMVMRRDLVKNIGQYEMTQIIKSNAEMREALEWLYNNVDILQMYTTGGKPTGTYYNSIKALSELYLTFKDNDLHDETPLLTTAGARKDMYLKMIISLSLTHSQEVRFWIRDQGEMAGNPDSPNVSHPVDRYLVYKRMYLAGKLQNAIFEQLEVEEMRYIMFSELGDDEIEWMRDWLPTVGKGLYTWPPVPYISIGNHYWYEQNYDPNYVDTDGQTWAQKYKLRGSAYDGSGNKSISGNYMIGFEARAPHLWMIQRYGGVCWQISNFGQNMTISYGVPSTTFGQPGHLAYSNYEMGTGTPAWALTNDVSGWSYTSFTGYTNTHTYHQVRQMNNWGAFTGEYALLRNRYGYPGAYVTLAQAAINDFTNYEKSQLLVKAAGVYDEELARQEQLLNQAIEVQDINFDAWYGLLATYAKQDKTAVEWYGLASKLANSNMKRFSLPFHDLMQTIITYIPNDNPDTVAYSLRTEMLLAEVLEWAAKANDSDLNMPNVFRQGGVSRQLANTLLGRLNNQIAVFSFDGDDAGKIKLGEKYAESSAAFEYSLDGGNTWHGEDGDWVTDKEIQLSAEQIASITEENDIKVHIQGVPREGNIYTIDIKESTLPNNLYANDKENRVVGVNTTMEWCEVKDGDDCAGDGSNWVSYRESSPLRVGGITIRVRVGATGVFVPSQPSPEYTFTTDTDPETRKYIPVSHLSVAQVSSQATGGGQYGNAIYAIDGNFNTRWHSAWNGSDAEQWIVIKFDHEVELAALGYVAAGGGNGRILQGDIYISDQEELKVENFRKVGQILNDCSTAEEGVLCTPAWPNVDNATITNLNPRTFEFRRTEQRVVVDDEGNPVLDENGQEQIEEVVTHEAITARYIAIDASQTSNHGNFIAARMLNFYEDRTQNPAPTAGIGFSTQEPTRDDVIARLTNTSEDELELLAVVPEGTEEEAGKEYVVSNGVKYVVVGQEYASYTFTENGEHTFYFRRKATGDEETDRSRKIGRVVAKVDWIYKTAPEPTVEYICVKDESGEENTEIKCDGSQKVNRSITAKLVFPNNDFVTILNNGKLNDDAEQLPEGDEVDDINNTQVGNDESGAGIDGEVDASDVDTTGDSTSESDDSRDPFTYLFMRNGKFTFEYVDKAGNYGEKEVEVSWIDKAAPKVALEYSTTEETEDDVTVRLVKVNKTEPLDNERMRARDFELTDESDRFDENGLEYGEDFIILNGDEVKVNEDGSAEYVFRKNGEFTFEYRDEARNQATMTARVDWIKKSEDPDQPDNPDNPDDPNKPDDDKPGIDQPNDDSSSGEQQPGNSGKDEVVNRPPANNDSVILDGDGEQVANNGDGGDKDGAAQGGLFGGNSVIETVGLPEGAKSESKRLTLNSALRAKFGSDSDYFELRFVDENGDVLAERPQQVKIAVTSGKKLIGVYRVKDDGTTESVDYEMVDGGIVISNPEAGKYLLDYEDHLSSMDKPEDLEGGSDERKDEKAWYENPVLWWGAGAAVVLVVAGVGVKMIANRKRD